MNFEPFLLLGVYQGSGEVCRQQVRSKLNPAEPGIYNFCQCADSQCFCETRHTFEQYVSVREEGNHQVLDKVFLSDYDLAHFEREQVSECALVLDAVV